LRGWGVVQLLYLLACALQYRYLNNKKQGWVRSAQLLLNKRGIQSSVESC
jgi:hypothetical protein